MSRTRTSATAARLRLELLEGRLAPAVHTWFGASSDLWSDDANWEGGSPAGDPNADLVFAQAPAAANLRNRNDLPGLVVRSIRFPHNPGTYFISGEALTLTGEIAVGNTFGHFLSCDLILAGDVTFLGVGQPIAPSNLTFSGVISGEGSLTHAGNARLILSGANTFAGGVTLRGGGLTDVSGSSPFGTGLVLFDGGSIFTRTASFDNPYTVAASQRLFVSAEYGFLGFRGPGYLEAGSTISFASATLSFVGDLSGEGGLSGGGVESRLYLRGNNTFTGPVTISSGNLHLDSPNALPSTTAVTLGTARLYLPNYDVTLGSLASEAFGGTGTVLLNGARLTVGANGASTSYAGVISGNGIVTKVGEGTWTLSGNSTFTGSLNVVEGAVRLRGRTAAGAGSLTIEGGALEVAADVTVPEEVENAGGTLVIEPGAALRADYVQQTAGATYLLGGTLASRRGVTVGKDSYLGGFGVLDATVFNGGFLDVGGYGAAGVLVITGDYQQGPAATLRVELGDLSGGNYDRLDILGTAFLAGTLDVALLDDFAAVEGDEYRVLNWAEVSGGFDAYNLPDLGGGFFLDLLADANGLTLRTSQG